MLPRALRKVSRDRTACGLIPAYEGAVRRAAEEGALVAAARCVLPLLDPVATYLTPKLLVSGACSPLTFYARTRELNDITVSLQNGSRMPSGRKAAAVQGVPELEALLDEGVPRVRAKLAIRIASVRNELCWNWATLAAEAGVHHKLIEGIETGVRDPRFSTVVKLALALKLHSLDELLAPLPFATLSETSPLSNERPSR